MESDIVYERKAITSLLEDPHPDIMLVTPVTKFQDQYYIGCDEEGFLVKCSIEKNEIITETGDEPAGELVGIHKISNKFYLDMLEVYQYRQRLEEMYHNGEHPEKTGYEFILEDVATWAVPTAGIADENGRYPAYPSGGLLSTRPLYVLTKDNLQWYEIDDENDLKFAEQNIAIQ